MLIMKFTTMFTQNNMNAVDVLEKSSWADFKFNVS